MQLPTYTPVEVSMDEFDAAIHAFAIQQLHHHPTNRSHMQDALAWHHKHIQIKVDSSPTA